MCQSFVFVHRQRQESYTAELEQVCKRITLITVLERTKKNSWLV